MLLTLFSFLVATASAQCAYCEFVVQTIEGFIESNSTEKEIVTFLENSCKVLPEPYSDMCAQEVDQWGSTVIEWIIMKEDPQVICTQLHLCTSKVSKRNNCGLCEMLVTYAEDYLGSNNTVNGLEAYLEAACADLPAPYNSDCDALVAAQLPALVQWLLAKEPPELFCTQVGLCSKKRSK